MYKWARRENDSTGLRTMHGLEHTAHAVRTALDVL